MEGRERGRGMQPLDEIEVGGAISVQAIRQEALRVAHNEITEAVEAGDRVGGGDVGGGGGGFAKGTRPRHR